MYPLLDGSVSYSGDCLLNIFLDVVFWHVRHLSMHFVEKGHQSIVGLMLCTVRWRI